MRVDAAQIPGQGDLKVKSGSGSFVSSLKEGDRLRAEVLSNDRGAVVMKADGGQTFKARLDLDVALSPGDNVLLEMVGKTAGIVTLSIREEQPVLEESAGQPESTRGFEDKGLLQYAGKLAEMNLPVTEESARMIRDIISADPDISLDEAAFIVSNKLPGDESLVRTAISMLSGGEKAGAMIEHLIAMLDNGEFGIRNSEFGINAVDASIERTNLDANGEILNNIGNAGAAQTNLDANGEFINNIGNVGIAQTNMEANGEFIDNIGNADVEQTRYGAQGEVGLNAGNAGVAQTSMDAQSAVANGILAETDYSEFRIPNSAFSSFRIPHSEFPTLGQWLAAIARDIIPQSNSVTQSRISTKNVEITDSGAANGEIRSEEQWDSDGQPVVSSQTITGAERDERLQGEASAQIEGAGKAIAELLSELQEFRGTPPRALERFSDMLLRIAGENPDILESGSVKLADLLSNAFARIEKNDKESGMRLKNAKEELFARLALFEEAVSRAAQPEKAMMLEQTRRLMDQVRLLNNINQFAYMQIPVQMGDEKKTAELYVFKKKGSKRLDPENVNILLALDLENMGHWEGLISFRKRDVSVKMQVRGGEEKAYFSENTVMLHELLAEAGFKLVNTEITNSKEETTPLTALAVLARQTIGRAGIDYII